MYYELAHESYMNENNDHYNQALMKAGASVEISDQQTNLRNTSGHEGGAGGLKLRERGYKQFDHRVQPMLYFMKNDQQLRSLSSAN